MTIKPTLLAVLFLLCVLPSVGTAASSETASRADLEAVQAQMQALAQRLDRLEAANAELQAENAELKALAELRAREVEPPDVLAQKTSARVAASAGDAEQLKRAEWATRVKVRGDLRYRHDHMESEQDVAGTAEDAADRVRQRIRARVAVDAAVTDTIRTTLALSTGGDDPRGTNQTLGGAGTKKTLDLDLAYADWRFMEGGNLVLGKQPYPVWRPVHGLFFDSDFNPEGGAVRFARGNLFANAYGYWLTEQYTPDPAGENTDSGIVGLQAGVKFAGLGGETTLAANYYVCGACKDHSPLYANNANGNTTYQVGTVNVLQYGYDILDLSAQVGAQLGELPVLLTGGYARNLAAGVELDAAYALGAHLGRLGDPGSWEAGLLYQSIDKDALFGQLVDSDFGNGFTDSEGWVLKAGYVPVRNVALNTTLYIHTMNKDVGTKLDVTRLQLDVNYKF